jgi:hypothetical protein
MRDPVERMVKWVQEQKQKALAEHARAVWSRRLPALLPCVEEVVEVFRRGLVEPLLEPAVAVHAEPNNEMWPLVVLFRERPAEREDCPHFPLSPAVTETGASAVFRCREDGVVCGFRYPFHAVPRTVRPEWFADLGEPAGVTAERLGNAVADFLEWAAVGEGCGRRKLRFWSADAAVEGVEEPVRLGIVTGEREAA